MADTVVASADSIITWFNNDVAVDAGNYFKVQKRAGTIELFRVDEDGDVIVTGDILRGQAHSFENTLGGSGTMVSFKKDTSERLKIAFSSSTNTTSFSASSDLVVRSAKDIIFQVDHDSDATATFSIAESSGNSYLTVAENGDFALQYGGATCFALSGGLFTLGDGAETRGHFLLENDQTGGSERAALLVLEDKTGAPWYFWLDSTNDLRVSSADPGTNDLAGVVVGA